MDGVRGRVAAAEIRRHLPYAVGLRVLSDRGLLRQIRAELAGGAMSVEEIARLENVDATILLDAIERQLGPEPEGPSAVLRRFATENGGFEAVSWETTRKKSSRLHLVSPGGLVLCGTPLRPVRSPRDGGPCLTCAQHAGVELALAA